MKYVLLSLFWLTVLSWYAYVGYSIYGDLPDDYDYIVGTHSKIHYFYFAAIPAITALNVIYLLLKRNQHWWKLMLIGLFTFFLVFQILVGINQI